jgi:hypothetical protein
MMGFVNNAWFSRDRNRETPGRGTGKGSLLGGCKTELAHLAHLARGILQTANNEEPFFHVATKNGPRLILRTARSWFLDRREKKTPVGIGAMTTIIFISPLFLAWFSEG